MASPSRPVRVPAAAEPRGLAVNIPDVIRTVLSELAELVARRNAEVEVGRTAENLVVSGPEDAVHQVLYHVVRNALEATPPRGVVRILQHQLPGEVVVEVTDEGAGIAGAYMSKIFTRGFTTKQGAKGQGLAEAEQCIGRLRGAIAWESPLRTGKGCRFTVTLHAGSATLAPS